MREMERRCQMRAETLMAQKPGWIDFLPEDPTSIAMVYISYSKASNDQYSLILSKPEVTPGEIETLHQITVSEANIDAANKWLDDVYPKFIDQHDDERHALALASIQGFVKTADDVRKRVGPVLTFARHNFEAQLAKLAESQS